ncbi:hypothetical protein H0H81_012441 [Sphagnurus paluster]|uniref:Uncharacterized protein n=1 Tax=Sphagnurus paluster TaxID=117069 RepID=A0A9P7FMM5_9AGAR|nr:hypothetical protein H0H81_012441 [Sphagnurus paluster]
MTAIYFSLLTRGATEARGDDIGNIKKAIAHWINKMYSPSQALDADKTNRGLQHDTTGLLLCPIEHDWKDLE